MVPRRAPVSSHRHQFHQSHLADDQSSQRRCRWPRFRQSLRRGSFFRDVANGNHVWSVRQRHQRPGILGVLGGCPRGAGWLQRQICRHSCVLQLFPQVRPESVFCRPGSRRLWYAGGSRRCRRLPDRFRRSGAFPTAWTRKSGTRSLPTYNALTINLEKRFSKHFQLLSSYTWSHSIDDGTDLQSTLRTARQPVSPQYEKGNSVNNKPQRWVTSGVFQVRQTLPSQEPSCKPSSQLDPGPARGSFFRPALQRNLR